MSPSRLLPLLATVLLVTACGGSEDSTDRNVLRVTAIPDEEPTALLERFSPLGLRLERELGVEVEFVPVTDYAATVSALAAGQVDLVWYGGFTFVQARRATKGEARPIVMRDRDARFQSVFITRKESGISTLGDLEGKTFAFGSESSTSGHLMPRFFLKKNDVSVEDFARHSFTGAHDATAIAVATGQVDAGVLNIAIWERLVRDGKMDPEEVVVFWTTPTYADYNWTVRGDLDRSFGEGFTERLAKAFLDLDPADPEDARILELQSAGRYIPARSEDFDGIEQAAREAGLIRDVD